MWVSLISAKLEVAQFIKDYCAMVKTQFNMLKFLSDNGLECLCLKRFYADNDILHETSCVDTPHKNFGLNENTDTQCGTCFTFSR